MFEVDGLKFGCALCIEVTFPELFAESERLGVDAVLFSAYPGEAIFAVNARAHAANNNYRIAQAVPNQTSHLFRSALIGPDGTTIAQVQPGDDLLIAEIDRTETAFHIAVDLARPWRARTRAGQIYVSRRVDDPRSDDHTSR